MISPVVSVVTSCYNAANFLSEAIESILLQTFEDFEFILIDDGSKDDTLAMIRHYAAKDNRIVIVEKPNTGLADSLNTGVQIARGEWIARIDADDVALPRRLESQLDYVRTHSDVILVGSGCIEIDQAGEERGRYHYPSEHNQLVRHLERGSSPFPHSTAFFKAQSVGELGGYRVRMNGSEDVDLWLRMSAIGRIQCLREPLIKFRKHDASITARNSTLSVLFYAAIISHNLRKLKYPDPVEQSDDSYQSFLEWIKRQLFRENVFDAQDLWFELRRDWFRDKSESLSRRSLRLVSVFIRSGRGLQLVRYRFFGSGLATKLTFEWVQSRQ